MENNLIPASNDIAQIPEVVVATMQTDTTNDQVIAEQYTPVPVVAEVAPVVNVGEVEQPTDVVKVEFAPVENTDETHDFSEFVEEVPNKAVSSGLLGGALSAMAHMGLPPGFNPEMLFGKMGGGKPSKNYGAVISPERLAEIAINNTQVQNNAFNKDKLERAKLEKQAKQILGQRPTKAQKKALKKARTAGRLAEGVAKPNEQTTKLPDLVAMWDGVSPITAENITTLNPAENTPEVVKMIDGWVSDSPVTTVDDTPRSNIGDVLDAVEVAYTLRTPEEMKEYAATKYPETPVDDNAGTSNLDPNGEADDSLSLSDD